MSVAQVASPPDRLIIVAEIQHASLARTFDYWIKPDLLCQWWPQEAEIQPQVGGTYHLSWPKMNWHLRGHFTAFEPGELLTFTWKWDHEGENVAVKDVRIVFETSSDEGTKLTLTHGPYADTQEDQDRRINQHLEGWMHFLPRLQAVMGAS